MSRSIREEAGLGKKTFTTNRVECVNSMLKLDKKDKLLSVDAFVELARGLVSRQQRLVEMAIVGKGTFEVHPRLKEKFEVPWHLWELKTKVSFIF